MLDEGKAAAAAEGGPIGPQSAVDPHTDAIFSGALRRVGDRRRLAGMTLAQQRAFRASRTRETDVGMRVAAELERQAKLPPELRDNINEAYLRWLESDDPATENDPPPLPANAGAPAPVAVADALDPELAALGAVGIDAHGYPIWGGAPDREDWSDDDGPYMGDYDTDNEYE
jgi:hypothetical protein